MFCSFDNFLSNARLGLNMEYEDNCNHCGTEIRITGAYIGSYEDCYCETCGWEGEYVL